MKPVKSSIIKGYEHDPTTRILTLHFHDGGIYEYQNVTESEATALDKAPSAGAHFAKHIKTKKSYRKKKGGA